jgi:hypothetical protein
VASRTPGLAGRMMRLDLLTGVAGVGGATNGLTATSGAGTGGTEGTGTDEGVGATAGAGMAATTGSGPLEGGWKRRADLRNSGSIGGVGASDFFAASGKGGTEAGVT